MTTTTVKTRLIQIGNSQGIRIPKPVLEQLGLSEDIELEILPDQLIVRSATVPRAGWAKQFEAMAAYGDDELLDELAEDYLTLSEWDDEEWVW
jgi:antitoxin MazE